MDLATIQSIWSKLNGWVSGLKDLKTLPDYTHHPLSRCASYGAPPLRTMSEHCLLSMKEIKVELDNPVQLPVLQNDANSYILPIAFSKLEITGTFAQRCNNYMIKHGQTNPYPPLMYTEFLPSIQENAIIEIFVQWTGSSLIPYLVYFSDEDLYWGKTGDLSIHAEDGDRVGYEMYCMWADKLGWLDENTTNAQREGVSILFKNPFRVEIIKQLYQGLDQAAKDILLAKK